MEKRTGWREQNESQIIGEEKRSGRLVGVNKTSKKRTEWCRLQRKNLNILGLLKRKVWPQCDTERAVGKYARAALVKRKRSRAVCPKHQIVRRERVKMSESRILAKERAIRAGAWRRKGGLHDEGRQIPRRRGRASKKSLPRRKHERMSGRKSSPGQSAESWFHS